MGWVIHWFLYLSDSSITFDEENTIYQNCSFLFHNFIKNAHGLAFSLFYKSLRIRHHERCNNKITNTVPLCYILVLLLYTIADTLKKTHTMPLNGMIKFQNSILFFTEKEI